MRRLRFKNGDRVVFTRKTTDYIDSIGPNYGDIGTVIMCEDTRACLPWNYGVEFDSKIKCGHTCCDHCERGHGWYVFDNEIELYSECENENKEFIFDEDDFDIIIGDWV